MEQNRQYSTPYQQGEDQQEEIQLLIKKYLRYWRWFVLGVVVCMSLAFIYNRYAKVVYSTEGSIKILKDQESGMDLSGLEGGGALFGIKEVNLENEIEIIKSRRLLDSIVSKLELTTFFQKVGKLTNAEIWGTQKPFLVHWHVIDTAQTKDFPVFRLNYKSETEFEISLEEGELKEEVYSVNSTFNTLIKMGGYEFVVLPNPAFRRGLEEEHTTFSYLFKKTAKSNVINSLKKSIAVEPVGKQSEILNISYQGENKKKNEDIVNQLIQEFNKDGIRDKQLISQRTEEFVAERSRLLFEELDTVEAGLVKFKQEGEIVTIESTAGQLFQKETESERKRYEIETQIELIKAFKQELESGEAYNLLPANLGIESQGINNLTDEFNQSVFERQELLISSTGENPTIKHIERKLDDIKSNILSSISSYISEQEVSLKNIRLRENYSTGRLRSLAEQEKGIRSITRQQEVKERLYLFLLQKREEAALKYAITSPTIKLVDEAYTNPNAIAPKSKIIYLAGIILGGIIPFGILYVRFLFDTKIEGREEVKRAIAPTPVIGEIPLIDKKHAKLVVENDRSILAEAFRILRTNLKFLENSKNSEKNVGKTIFVTSSIKGEGKTLTSLNLAHTLAATQKKVLIIGCDLRNPQVHTYYGYNKNIEGLTNYLSDRSLSYKDVLITGDKYFSNLDLIVSGPIPPNPAELLINGRFQELLEETKQDYDYVIVDTAPTILVTDTLLISDKADFTVYMTKSGHTDKRLLEHIKELVKEEKLKNVGVVINGINQRSGYGYNYGYGYGYTEDLGRSKWKFWKRN